MKKLRTILLLIVPSVLCLSAFALTDAQRLHNLAMFQWLKDVTTAAGIPQESDQQLSTLNSQPSTSIALPPGPGGGTYGTNKLLSLCTLRVTGSRSPNNLLPSSYALNCVNNLPSDWAPFTDTASCCSGDLVVAVWSTNAIRTNAWTAMTFNGQGQYRNPPNQLWGPIAAIAKMAAGKCVIMAQPFEHCPEEMPDEPIVRVAVRCSDIPPIIGKPPTNSPPSNSNTNHLLTGPSSAGSNYLSMSLTNWSANSVVEIWENPDPWHNNYWICVSRVTTSSTGTATTNIERAFPSAFYYGRKP